MFFRGDTFRQAFLELDNVAIERPLYFLHA